MPTYKDEKTGTWYCKFYYMDWTGSRKQKLKRSFKLQRDAKEWERVFLEKQACNPDMTFQALYELYMEDISTRLKESTVDTKKKRIQYRILPYFKDKPINQITPSDVRNVPIPEFLCRQIREYMGQVYGLRQSDRLFMLIDISARDAFRRACERSGVKRIRIHDLRHSHESLLIELGFPALLIAERIGDTVGMVNDIYGHLYPNRHEEVAVKLRDLVSN